MRTEMSCLDVTRDVVSRFFRVDMEGIEEFADILEWCKLDARVGHSFAGWIFVFCFLLPIVCAIKSRFASLFLSNPTAPCTFGVAFIP